MTCHARVLTVVLAFASILITDGAATAGPPRAATPRPAAGAPAARTGIYTFPAAANPSPASAPAGHTEAIYQAALQWFDRAEPMVDKLVPVAEQAAESLLSGGTLYVSGNGGFADEYDFRAGGFPFTEIWQGQELEDDDVLLIGNFRPNEMENPRARIDYVVRGYGRRFGGAMAVHLSGHDWPQISRSLPAVNSGHWHGRLHLVDTGAPEGAGIKELCIGQFSATVLGWVLHGEIISAATRKGKTLATYASDWEPGGRDWDASVKGRHEHPKYKVPPIPAGKIGKQYLKTCRGQLAEFLATQPGQVRLAGRRMAESMKKGGVVWAITDSHVLPRGAVVPAELTRMKMFGRSYDWGYFSRSTPKGDLLLWMGYLRYPRGTIEAAKRRGCDAVVVTVDKGPTDEHTTHVRSCWKDFDTVIDLPDYPIRVLPSSGVMHTVQWYALMAETLAADKGPR